MIKVGVVGLGGMGTTHYMSLKTLEGIMDIKVTAIADSREEKLEKAKTCFPEALPFNAGMDLIEQADVDAIHICLPSYLHCEYALAAMKKGRHVLIEKPVCLSKEECDQLLEAEKTYGVKVMVGQVVRSFDEYKYLKKCYDSRCFGELKSLVMTRLSGNVTWGFEDWFHDEAKSGSVVLDLHVHDVDFLRYMLGEPDSLSVKATAYDSGMINQIITDYRFGKVVATAEGLWDISPALKFQAGFRAAFEQATVQYSGANDPALVVFHADGTTEIPELEAEYDAESNEAGINISKQGPYFAEIKYFYTCIQNDEPITLAPLSEGVKSVLLALEELRHAKEFVS